MCLYKDEEDSLKLPNTSTALECTSVNTHQPNIALLSVAASKNKRVLESTAAVVAQLELGYKSDFPNQSP